MDNNKRSTKKSNITIKIIKIIFSIILGVIAGPLELFWLKFIDVENRSFQIFWLIIGILSFSILYLVMLIILNKIINRNDHNSDKCWYIMRILAPISILITYFIIGKINNEGTISCVILSIIFMIPNLPLFIPFELANGSSTSTKNKKIRATTWNFGNYKETTYRDENGNKIGEATSFDWGPVRDTTIKDKDGNETKIEHWKF